jgi:hypothetical protein
MRLHFPRGTIQACRFPEGERELSRSVIQDAVKILRVARFFSRNKGFIIPCADAMLGFCVLNELAIERQMLGSGLGPCELLRPVAGFLRPFWLLGPNAQAFDQDAV